jgi:HEAT repeat protein
MRNALLLSVLMSLCAAMPAMAAGGKAHAPVTVTAQSLLADLAGPDDVAQSRARRLLQNEGVAVAPDLIALLSHTEARVWCAAFNTLSDLAHRLGTPGYERELKTLADMLSAALRQETALEVKERVLRLMPFVAMEKYDLAEVGALLRDASLAERARVALREIGTVEAARELAKAADEVPAEFVPAVAEALASIGNPPAMAQLRKLAKHDDAMTRAIALRGLAALGDPELHPLIQAVRKKATPETMAEVEDAWLRWLEAVGERGGNVQRVMAWYRGLYESSQSEVIRGAALTGLARYGDEGAARFLAEALREETPLSAQLLYAMRFQQGRAADVLFRDGYAGVNAKYRAQYLQQLSLRKNPLLVDTFKAAINETDQAVTQAAVHGLVRLGVPEVITALVAASEDNDTMASEIMPLLIELGRDFAAQGNRDAAGRAFLGAYVIAPPDKAEMTAEALEGIKANPIPEAAKLLAETLDDAALAAMPIATLEEIRRTVEAAGLAERAAALGTTVIAKLAEPGAVQQIVDYANRTGQQDTWKSRLGFIRHWQLVGPFPFVSAEGFQTHIGAPAVDLAAEYPPAQEGTPPLKWQPFEAGDLAAMVPLSGLIGMIDHASAYAYANIRVEADTDAMLCLGSDDGVRAWLNGEQVHENNVDRGAAVDSDRVPVKLKAGDNALLLQISQNGGGWIFLGRLTQADGKPLVFSDAPAPAPAPEAAPAPAQETQEETAPTQETTA